jgi:hypothetical protein
LCNKKIEKLGNKTNIRLIPGMREMPFGALLLILEINQCIQLYIMKITKEILSIVIIILESLFLLTCPGEHIF